MPFSYPKDKWTMFLKFIRKILLPWSWFCSTMHKAFHFWNNFRFWIIYDFWNYLGFFMFWIKEIIWFSSALCFFRYEPWDLPLDKMIEKNTRNHFGTLMPFVFACQETGYPRRPLDIPENVRFAQNLHPSVTNIQDLELYVKPVRKGKFVCISLFILHSGYWLGPSA